ncbi:hypothetical protein EV207_1298 [Scopulibacillus darangshiensis]|uniref:Uncharacterized protein n=1 Tax=Scopulibacillus darangshiensis TaxID=442528 RepID=A0A4R2NQJ9_9BACL|nr:hypothetical protein EV207_1298 [Scopulibacillus darangshiensis]
MKTGIRDKYQQIGIAMTSRSFQEYYDMFKLQEGVFQKGWGSLDLSYSRI